MSTLEIPKRFFFRFSLPCRYVPLQRGQKGVADFDCLDETYRFPDFCELENRSLAASVSVDFRMGWNEKHLHFSATVTGKKRLPWCKPTHLEESEGIQICLDTRDVRNVHRATRFCQRFAFWPLGQGLEGKEPVALWFPIHRAKGHPNAVTVNRISVKSEQLSDGYRLAAVIPGDVLTGYDPNEHSRLGFHYYVVDKECGDKAFLVGRPFPHDQDPSLWGTLECQPEK